MKLGVNTVLFKCVDVKSAMKAIKTAGYDGVELSAIQGMCEHLVLDAWETQAPLVKAAAMEAGVELLSMEVASLDEDRLTKAFKAAQYANGFNVDPFEGFAVHFNNSLPAYADASEDDVYAIVGDFG